jgi:hypothetical protein
MTDLTKCFLCLYRCVPPICEIQGNRMTRVLFSREKVFQQVTIPACHPSFPTQARFGRRISL